MRALRHLFQSRRRDRQNESRIGQVLLPTAFAQSLVSIVNVPAQPPQGTFRYALLLPTELAVSCCEHCRVPRASVLAPLSSQTRPPAIGQQLPRERALWFRLMEHHSVPILCVLANILRDCLSPSRHAQARLS
jgi:hypothetical protein